MRNSFGLFRMRNTEKRIVDASFTLGNKGMFFPATLFARKSFFQKKHDFFFVYPKKTDTNFRILPDFYAVIEITIDF